MHDLIKDACLKVSSINMWDTKPVSIEVSLNFEEDIQEIAIAAFNFYESYGATEQDIADAIYYIATVYALPPIKDNRDWFRHTLDAILEITFPDAGLEGRAKIFAKKMLSGINDQLHITIEEQ